MDAADHCVVTLRKAQAELAADEAVRANDEDVHVALFSTGTRARASCRNEGPRCSALHGALAVHSQGRSR
jgi:hypothetical protein